MAELDIDELGSGASDSLINGISDTALAMLDDLSIDKVLVCGNSLGALIGLDFASRHPERTAGMIFSGCPGLGEKIIDTSYMVSHSEREVLEEFRSRMFHNEPAWVAPLMEETIEMALPRPIQLKMLKLMRAASAYDTLGCVPRVTCPTCVVWGEFDRITPLDNWEPHFAEFPDAETHIVPECGHSPMIEKADEWMDLMLNFLGRVIRPSDAVAVGGAAAPAE